MPIRKIPPFRQAQGRNETTDFLVIGSGIAGLNFALQVAKFGKVVIVTKKELAESNTNYAQGGIASVLSKTDNFKKHIADTLKAGCFLNDKKAVEVMVKQGPREIKRLLKLGVGFSKAESKLCLTREGGHSQHRVAHVNDTTGKEIERALIHQVRHNKNIKIFESHLSFKLLTKKQESKKTRKQNGITNHQSLITNHCYGALVLDIENNQIKTFFSKATIMATGGAGQVYLRNSNPKIATGDGIALAYEIGAEIKDLEFIQFHPTALNKPIKPAFLLSEALRGEGAKLVNSKGQRFMHKYHKLAELAPRDIVSRAIFNEEKNHHKIFLDIRHKGAEFIKQRFPYIYNELWWYGIKMDKDLIPVSPAAHFICGGVHTDLNGKTNIPRLFAFGEVAHTGVHGANRLASNSLLEAMVFSSRAVKSAQKYVKNNHQSPIINHESWNMDHGTNNTNTNIKKIKHEIQKLMWQNVGIIRETKKMKITLHKLNENYTKILQLFDKGVNKDIIELKNLCLVAILITKAAMARKKSAGCHYLWPNIRKKTKLRTAK